jgi:hypothetical protein
MVDRVVVVAVISLYSIFAILFCRDLNVHK